MIRTIISAFIIVLLLGNCNGQAKMKEKEISDKQKSPEINYKVNKEYDEDGNIIRYDSTYSYYYSNVENDTMLRDSIMNVFRNRFNQQYFFSEDPFFKEFFFQDSLMPYDFYKRDFFSNRFRYNMNEFDNLFMEMDSIKNEFFKKQFKESESKKSKDPVHEL